MRSPSSMRTRIALGTVSFRTWSTVYFESRLYRQPVRLIYKSNCRVGYTPGMPGRPLVQTEPHALKPSDCPFRHVRLRGDGYPNLYLCRRECSTSGPANDERGRPITLLFEPYFPIGCYSTRSQNCSLSDAMSASTILHRSRQRCTPWVRKRNDAATGSGLSRRLRLLLGAEIGCQHMICPPA